MLIIPAFKQLYWYIEHTSSIRIMCTLSINSELTTIKLKLKKMFVNKTLLELYYYKKSDIKF